MGTYTCEVCGDKFIFQQDVEKHLQVRHEPGKSRPTKNNNSRTWLCLCNMCSAKFPSEEDVRMHMELVHQDEEPPRTGPVYDVDDIADEEDDLVLKLKKLKEAVVPLKVKIRQGNAWPELREKLNKETADSLRTRSNNIKAGFVGVLEEIKQFALWNNKLKTVEGMYGSGVYNFFKFFKWSMGLNLMMMLLTMLIVIPESFNDDEEPVCPVFSLQGSSFPTNISDECCSELYLEKQKLEEIHVSMNIDFFEDVGNILLDMVFGDGYCAVQVDMKVCVIIVVVAGWSTPTCTTGSTVTTQPGTPTRRQSPTSSSCSAASPSV